VDTKIRLGIFPARRCSMAERRQFTREFKVEAVRLVVEEERPRAQVARELDIGRNLLQCGKRENAFLKKAAA
jgi:transposase-like protein